MFYCLLTINDVFSKKIKNLLNLIFRNSYYTYQKNINLVA